MLINISLVGVKRRKKKMHELQHEFINRKISPWGGVKYFYGTYVQCGMRDILRSVGLPEPGSNRGYDPVDLVEGFICSVILGSKRLAHTGMIRTDEVIREIFGWKRGMADQSTFSRFFKKHSVETNDEIFPRIMRHFFDKIDIDRMTIDIDSTVITRYGDQEEAKVGYNPEKRGRKSHHPIMAFCDELAMVVNAWMRSGDSVSMSNTEEFLEEVFRIVPVERIGLMRFDSGFFSQKIMELLENQSSEVKYIIRGKITSSVAAHILEQRHWFASNDVMKGAEYCVTRYQGHGWEKSRKMIIVRIPKSKIDQCKGILFESIAEYERYEYKVFMTNVEFSAQLIHGLYNKRANAENRIKDLKYDYGIEGFSMQDFGAMEAAFRYVMIAYNVMAVFKQIVMKSAKGKMLSTIRFQCIAIGSYLVNNGRKKILKLSAEGKRRHFLEHFFKNMEYITPPLKFSNA
jgi:hypothetical protein